MGATIDYLKRKRHFVRSDFYSGREYGTASIEIHVKACAKRWEIDQSQKPKNERRPLPEAPRSFD
jgi:hypothetical protein